MKSGADTIRLLRSHCEDRNKAKRSKIETKETDTETEMEMQAITSTEESIKAKTAKSKLPTEGTNETTTTVKKSIERVPPFVLKSNHQWKDIHASMKKEKVDVKSKVTRNGCLQINSKDGNGYKKLQELFTKKHISTPTTRKRTI